MRERGEKEGETERVYEREIERKNEYIHQVIDHGSIINVTNNNIVKVKLLIY